MTKTQLQGVGQNKLPKWANPACQSQVFLQVVAQKLDRIIHQRYRAHLATLSQKTQLRRWIQS